MRELHGREREAGTSRGVSPTVLGNTCHPIGCRAGSATAVPIGPTQPTRAYRGTCGAVYTSLKPEVSSRSGRVLVISRTNAMATHIIPQSMNHCPSAARDE